jgi:pyridoxal phosphate phosphatase PHOSPHO2
MHGPPPPPPPPARAALVLDFDHSLIDVNSDTFVPQELDPSLLPFIREESRRGVQWTALMDDAVRRLAEAGKGSEAALRGVLSRMPAFPEALEAVRGARGWGATEIHVVSDANTVYIDEYLRAAGLRECVDSVTTNPAGYEGGDEGGDGDGDGATRGAGAGSVPGPVRRLRIRPYVPADGPPHGCPLCPVNLCKGLVMDALRLSAAPSAATPAASLSSEGGEDGGAAADPPPPPPLPVAAACGRVRVLYVGDGAGDVCPCLRLGPGDVALARDGYPLAERLRRAAAEGEGVGEGTRRPLRATVRLWKDGAGLRDEIRAFFLGAAGGGEDGGGGAA